MKALIILCLTFFALALLSMVQLGTFSVFLSLGYVSLLVMVYLTLRDKIGHYAVLTVMLLLPDVSMLPRLTSLPVSLIALFSRDAGSVSSISVYALRNAQIMFANLAAVILIALLFFRKGDEKRPTIDLNYTFEPGVYHILIVLVVTAFAYINLISNALFELPVISYFGRLSYSSFVLFNFFVGRWYKRLGIWFYIFVSSVLLNSAYIMLSGGRFSAFMPLILLALGVVFSFRAKARNIVIVMGIMFFPVFMFLIGVLGAVREQIGRGSIAMVDESRVSLFLEAFGEKLDDVFSEKPAEEDYGAKGVGRMKNETQERVLTMTPEKIPYRGLENLDKELGRLFYLAALDRGFSIENIKNARKAAIENDLGAGMANRYGFYVTEENSVNFGLVEDAWSRGGAWVVYLYTLILFTVAVVFEYFIRKVPDEVERSLLISVLLYKLIFKMGSVPLVESIRSFMLFVTFTYVVIIGTRMLYRLLVGYWPWAVERQ